MGKTGENVWVNEFKRKLKEKCHGEYELVGDYKNKKTKVWLKHTVCGELWHAWPYDAISRRHGCPKCNSVTKTHDEFIAEVKNKTGNSVLVLGRYVNGNHKIEFKHAACGTTWTARPQGILLNASRGHVNYGCPLCEKESRKKTNAKKYEEGKKQRDLKIKEKNREEKTRIANLLSGRAKIVKEYKASVRIKWLCCGSGQNVKYGVQDVVCKMCNTVAPKIIKEIHSLVGSEYQVIKVYSKMYYGSNNTHVKLKHLICGDEYEIGASRFIGEGVRCCRCNNIAPPKTHEEYIKDFQLIHSEDEYQVVSVYKGSANSIKIKHLDCGRIYSTRASIPLLGYGCPRCKSSRMEKAVREYLIKKQIKFDEQVSFDDCKHKGHLKFDFKIKPKTKKSFLLEMDGEFHYKPIYGEDHLAAQKQRDRIKDKYCEDRKLKLVRIPYYRKGEFIDILEPHIDGVEQLSILDG